MRVDAVFCKSQKHPDFEAVRLVARSYVPLGWLVLAVVLSVFGVHGARILTRHACVAMDRMADAGLAVSQTAQHLNAPHGTIAMIDEDAGATKSLIVHADLVARHEQQSMSTWDNDARDLFTNANGAVTDLRGTANAATTALQGVPPVLDGATHAVKTMDAAAGHLDAAINAPEVVDATKHLDSAIGHTDGILGDFQTRLHPILNPDPCKTKKCKLESAAGKATSAGGFAEAVYYLMELGKLVF